jgi:hypothetical protein
MLARIDQKDALNAISGFLAAYGWVSLMCFFYLVTSWAGDAPHIPDPAHGLIFPHNEHGSITYFSALQGTTCALLFSTSPLLFIVAIYISPKKEIVYQSRKLGFSMKWKPDDPKKIQRVGMALGAVAAPLVVFLLLPSFVTYLNSIGFVTGF